jgi:membrane protein YdbS with pleckstrin-like domain
MHLPTGKSHSITSSFVVSPKSVKFDEQREGEELYMLIRKHQITNVPWVFMSFCLLLAPLIINGFFEMYFPSTLANFGLGFLFLLTVFWYLVVFVYFFEQFLLWFYTVNIITDDRIVDIDFTGLFNKDFAEVQHTKIQDVHSVVSGPLAVMFNYGTVTVQTAAEKTIIEFDHVPNPDEVSKFIGELVAEKGGSIASRLS